jgi:hypothetical protein
MAKWLDKYEQGGLVLEKKTKDNYGKKPNVNDVKVSAGPNFVGEGYTAYNWKSPAWGGQFAMGGSMPGAVGFTYARTAGSAPANGKYTKKTQASAQFGIELMPYVAQAAVKISNSLPTVDEVADKAKEVLKKSPTARKLANKVISSVANSDWGKQKLKNLASNMYPRGYSDIDNASPIDKVYSAAILNKKEKAREELDRDLAIPGKTFPTDSVRVDLLNRYAGLPEKYGTLKPSAYKPTIGNNNEKYFSSPQVEREILSNLDVLSGGINGKATFKTKKDLENFIAKNVASHKEDPSHPGEFDRYTTMKGKGSNYVAPVPGLGQATYGIGEDEKGHYLSYYDKWDLNPYFGEYAPDQVGVTLNSKDQLGKLLLGNEKEDVATKHIGNPTNMYGRIYFDKKTGKPKMQNGGEMSFYQNGLDFKPKSISKNGSVIKDDRGQWAHPGEVTEIGSNDITMQGVDYPVLGISDTGDTQMMYPDQDYKFDGEKVTEYPMAQNGKKWLNKYATEPMRQDATRNIKFENSVKNTIAQYRRAIDPENQPHISKWTPKPGEIKRLEEQDRQRREENSGFLNRLAANPHVAKLQENIVLPMFDLYTLGEGAVAAKAISKPVLEQTGKYLTEKTALKNTYKINPLAETLEGKTQRQIFGDPAYESFLKHGPTTQPEVNVSNQLAQWNKLVKEASPVTITKTGENMQVAGTTRIDNSGMRVGTDYPFAYFSEGSPWYGPNRSASMAKTLGQERRIVPKQGSNLDFYPAGESSVVVNPGELSKEAIQSYAGRRRVLAPSGEVFNPKAFDVYKGKPHWWKGYQKEAPPINKNEIAGSVIKGDRRIFYNELGDEVGSIESFPDIDAQRNINWGPINENIPEPRTIPNPDYTDVGNRYLKNNNPFDHTKVSTLKDIPISGGSTTKRPKKENGGWLNKYK